jgi:hypothetical protein
MDTQMPRPSARDRVTSRRRARLTGVVPHSRLADRGASVPLRCTDQDLGSATMVCDWLLHAAQPSCELCLRERAG